MISFRSLRCFSSFEMMPRIFARVGTVERGYHGIPVEELVQLIEQGYARKSFPKSGSAKTNSRNSASSMPFSSPTSTKKGHQKNTYTEKVIVQTCSCTTMPRVLGGAGPGAVWILLNNGDGTFKTAMKTTVADGPYHLFAADFKWGGENRYRHGQRSSGHSECSIRQCCP